MTMCQTFIRRQNITCNLRSITWFCSHFSSTFLVNIPSTFQPLNGWRNVNVLFLTECEKSIPKHHRLNRMPWMHALCYFDAFVFRLFRAFTVAPAIWQLYTIQTQIEQLRHNVLAQLNHKRWHLIQRCHRNKINVLTCFRLHKFFVCACTERQWKNEMCTLFVVYWLVDWLFFFDSVRN